MSGNGSFHAAQHAATALLNGADPADVVHEPDVYGDWAPLIQNLAALYPAGGTTAVICGFDALARASLRGEPARWNAAHRSKRTSLCATLAPSRDGCLRASYALCRLAR